MKFVQLAKSLKEDGLQAAYLIEGEEAYFRDHAVKAIREACAITQPALNDVRYEGDLLKGDRLDEFADALFTLPFFDERRLVRVYEFYPTEKEWARTIRPFLSAKDHSTVLAIVNTGVKKTDPKRKKELVFVDCAKETEDALSRWLFGVCRRAGLAIDGDTATLFVRFCNSDAARLSLEVKKLGAMLGEGGKITREVVETYVAKDVEYKLFELTQAASRGNRNAFFEIYTELSDRGMDETALLSSLTSHFYTLSEIAGMRGSDADIARRLGLNPYAVKKNREALVRLGKGRAEELFSALYRLSSDTKSGLVSKTGAISAAVAKIFFG